MAPPQGLSYEDGLGCLSVGSCVPPSPREACRGVHLHADPDNTAYIYGQAEFCAADFILGRSYEGDCPCSLCGWLDGRLSVDVLRVPQHATESKPDGMKPQARHAR